MTPVEATLIAASLTAMASTVAVIMTHVLAGRRERLHHVWERRMDAYTEIIRLRRSLATTRRDVLQEKKFPDSALDPDHDTRIFWSAQAQLDMFASPEVRKMNDASFETLKAWTIKLLEWRDQSILGAMGGSGQGEEDATWDELCSLAEAAGKTDQQLIGAIKAEARFERRFLAKPKRFLRKQEPYRGPRPGTRGSDGSS